jgi:hypothetical protein
MSDRDLDAEFERIIAGWDDEAPDPQARKHTNPAPTPASASPDPARPDAARPDAARPEATPAGSPAAPVAGGVEPTAGQTTPMTDAVTDAGAPPAGGPGSGLLELPIAPGADHAWRSSGTPRRDDADELLDAVGADDDHFVPPSEIDLPSAENDPMFWAIVGGLVGGPLLLLYLLFFDRYGSGWWVVTALAMVVTGFVLLVLRGGTERDPFDDGTRV